MEARVKANSSLVLIIFIAFYCCVCNLCLGYSTTLLSCHYPRPGVLNRGYPYPLGVWIPNARGMRLDLWVLVFILSNPFSFDISRLSDSDLAKDDFIEFQEDPRKKADFERAGMDVKQFWCEQISAYPSLAMNAMNVLVPFTTTYLCETGFSALLNLKSKWRNRFDVSDDMQVALSVTVPRFHALIAQKQQ